MKAMLCGFAAIIVIGVGAWFVLESMGFSSQQVYSSPNVRLD